MKPIHYDFLRHAEAGPHEKDELRQITDRGIAQCLHRVTMLPKREYDVVTGSTAVRAKETAARIAPGVPIISSDALYFPTNTVDRTILDTLYKELGDAPLRGYLVADTTGVLLRYARKAERFIRAMTEDDPPYKNVLVVGHGVLLQAIGTMFTGDPKLTDLAVGTCEGFSVDIERQFKPIKD